jgi:uncharacterized caspase-like protein
MDAQVATDEAITKARGRKDKDKEDGAIIKTKTLKESLRELGECKIMADEAGAKLKAAVKAVAEKSGLLASVVRAMVKAQSGDSDQYADAARKVQQLAIVFDEIEYQGEITKATTKQ